MRVHLDCELKPRAIRACKPKEECVDRHATVVKELRARAKKAKRGRVMLRRTSTRRSRENAGRRRTARRPARRRLPGCSELRVHTNFVLASQWKDREANVLPWDLEMNPEDPEEAQLEQEPEQEAKQDPEQEAEGASAGGGGASRPPRARAGRSRG